MIRTRISIVTVCYNCVKTIEKTIKSVVNQNYPNLEYIVIDGGSADGTVDIIKKYLDSISYFISEKDDGIYNAMNKGLDVANGELIAFLNDGDWYEKGALDAVDQFYRDIKADAIYGNIKINCEGVITEREYRDDESYELYRGMCICHQAFFIKLDLVKKYKFDERYKVLADYNLLVHLYYDNIIFMHLNKCIVTYSLGGFSSVNSSLITDELRTIDIDFIMKHEPSEKKREIIDKDYFYRKMMDCESDWNKNAHIISGISAYISKLKQNIAVFGNGKNGHRMIRLLKMAGVAHFVVLDNKPSQESVLPEEVDNLYEYSIIVTPAKEKEIIFNQLFDIGVKSENILDFFDCISELGKKLV